MWIYNEIDGVRVRSHSKKRPQMWSRSGGRWRDIMSAEIGDIMTKEKLKEIADRLRPELEGMIKRLCDPATLKKIEENIKIKKE
jgi:hypothetical protein